MARDDPSKTEIPQKTLNDLVNVLERLNAPKEDSIEIHQKALDDLVNVNSLFTIAVFIDLSFASPNQHSLEARPECDADPGLAKRLVVYEVVSFACFLLSSLVAKSLKTHLYGSPVYTGLAVQELLLSEMWRTFLMLLTIVASIVGIWLLTLSMVNVIQIRLGKLSCGSRYTLHGVIPLFVVVLASQVIYAPSMMYGVFVTAYASYAHNNSKGQP
ncbi:hypothetical protein ACOSQ4_002869 [Xanthoceras sorbifolium]